MKNKFWSAAVLILTVLIFPAESHGMDIGVYGGAGNISFDTELKVPLSDESDPKRFDLVLFPLIRADVSGETGFIYYEGGFDRNPILRNQLFATIGINLTYFKIEVGPLIGLFNTSDEIFNPGFSAGMGLEFPGLLFLNFKASSSLGNALGTTGSYTQKTGSLSAGFWVPHVICSLNLNSQSFALKMETNLLAEDSLNRYFFRADVYTKNVPFTVKVDIGYGELKRSYYTQSVSGTELVSDVKDDELKFFYLGLEAAYTINPMFRLFLAGEMPVYSWSVPKMKNPEKGAFLFQARGGLILTL